MQNFKVVIGFHSDLPYNASDTLYEQVYQGSWRPYLAGLYKFASIKSVIYFSGSIFFWLEQKHPEYMYLLSELVRKGQIEMLGGGYYNPFATLISSQDMAGQIEALGAFIRKATGKRPTGAWLYEYCWTPYLPSVLQNSKLQYTFLPARLLLEPSNCEISCNPVTSEDHRKMITIFPTFESTTQDGLFVPYERSLLDLQQEYPGCNSFVLMANGLEIAQSWQESGAESPDVLFEKTFAWFQKNCLEYDTLTAIQLLKMVKPARTLYLSQCYSDRFRKYCDERVVKINSTNINYYERAKQAVVSHPLTHALYQKLNLVSARINLFRGDKARKKTSLDEIWRSQCGSLFWSGPEGGILLSGSRLAAYAALIEAEKTIRSSQSHEILSFDDINFDGFKEGIFQSSVYTCYIHTQTASISEFDSLSTQKNYACGWNETQFNTGCFKEFICEQGAIAEAVPSLSERWNLIETGKDLKNLSFGREFNHKIQGAPISLSCRKTFRFENDYFSIEYELTNKSRSVLTFCFCTLSDIIAAPSVMQHVVRIVRRREYESLDPASKISADSVDGIEISDSGESERVAIRSDRPFLIRSCPNYVEKSNSVSPQMIQMDKETCLFEGMSIRLGWDLSLPPEGMEIFSISVHLEY